MAGEQDKLAEDWSMEDPKAAPAENAERILNQEEIDGLLDLDVERDDGIVQAPVVAQFVLFAGFCHYCTRISLNSTDSTRDG